jgi:hypothetical protein
LAAEGIVSNYLEVSSSAKYYTSRRGNARRSNYANVVGILTNRIPSKVAAERIVGDYLSVAWIAGVDSGWRSYTSTGA